MTPSQLRKWRLTESLTQVELADLWGISPRTLTRYETGAVPIPRAIEIIVDQDISLKVLLGPKPVDRALETS